MSFKHSARVWQVELCTRDKAVLAALADSANLRGECWPKVSCLAQKTGLSRASIQRALSSLIEDGWIARQFRFRESCQISSRYTLNLGVPRQPCLEFPQPHAEAPRGLTLRPPPPHAEAPRASQRGTESIIESVIEPKGEQPPPFPSQIPQLIREQNAAILKVRASFKEGVISEQEATVRLSALYARLAEWETIKFGCAQTQARPLVITSVKSGARGAHPSESGTERGISVEECKRLAAAMKRAVGSYLEPPSKREVSPSTCSAGSNRNLSSHQSGMVYGTVPRIEDVR